MPYQLLGHLLAQSSWHTELTVKPWMASILHRTSVAIRHPLETWCMWPTAQLPCLLSCSERQLCQDVIKLETERYAEVSRCGWKVIRDVQLRVWPVWPYWLWAWLPSRRLVSWLYLSYWGHQLLVYLSPACSHSPPGIIKLWHGTKLSFSDTVGSCFTWAEWPKLHKLVSKVTMGPPLGLLSHHNFLKCGLLLSEMSSFM